MQKLYIGINQKAKKEIIDTGSTKLPYLQIAIPPEEQGGQWTTVGAAWMNEKKTGFNVRMSDGWEVVKKEPSQAEIDAALEKTNKELEAKRKAMAGMTQIEYPEEVINPEDIPF